MEDRISRLIDRLFHRRILRRQERHAKRAENVDLQTLRTMRGRQRELRRRADQILHIADARLTLPLIGPNAIEKPLHTDWAYRPELWRGPISPPGLAAVQSRARIGNEITLHHDCQISELTVRQVRNTREEDLAPFGLRLDVFRFDGSFLSLVVEMPDSAVEGLKRRHLVGLAISVEMEHPIEIFARLNIQHGPNTEQVVRELPKRSGDAFVEFDLAYTKLNEKRVDRAWLDLIFEGPDMNQIILRDITMTRRPRAEI